MSRHPDRLRRKHRFFLLFLDVLTIGSALSLLYHWRLPDVGLDFWFTVSTWLLISSLIVLVYIFGGYEVERFRRGRDAFIRLGVAVGVLTVFATLIVYVGFDERAGLLGRGVLLGSLLSFFLIASIARLLLFQSLGHRQRRATWIFVISSEWMDRVQRDLSAVTFPGTILFFTEKHLNQVPSSSSERLAFVVGLNRQVYTDNKGLFQHFLNARVEGHTVMDLTSFYELYWFKIPIQIIAPEWLVQVEGFSLFQKPVQLKFKRVFDLGLAVLLFLLSLPILLLTAVIIYFESKGPILYRQIRTGRNGKPFTIYKFRSMRVDAEKDGAQWAKVGDTRITRVGNFLRKSRIDELPQILNVLRGDMSFIGPRPERPEFNETLEKEIPYYQLRHLVNPGITGWAQILYPYGASVEDAWEKLQYDLYYIKNYSFWLDVRIALKTARIMILGRGR